MVEMPDASKYMDEVTVYDVQDAKTGEHIAVWMCDYFPRATKRQGAWMEQMQSGGLYGDGTNKRPIVYNVGNFTRPTGDAPALLTIDEVETTFHEFGHAPSGNALTRALQEPVRHQRRPRLCGNAPQILEHWAFAPEVLKSYAKHYKTGETIPDELVEKISAASKFNQGFVTTELAGSALLDLNYGKHNGENLDVVAFEKEIGDKDRNA